MQKHTSEFTHQTVVFLKRPHKEILKIKYREQKGAVWFEVNLATTKVRRSVAKTNHQHTCGKKLKIYEAWVTSHNCGNQPNTHRTISGMPKLRLTKQTLSMHMGGNHFHVNQHLR